MLTEICWGFRGAVASAGEDIYTYLDVDLQIAMTESLGGEKARRWRLIRLMDLYWGWRQVLHLTRMCF